MLGLAEAMCAHDWQVVFVSEYLVSPQRAEQGWVPVFARASVVKHVSNAEEIDLLLATVDLKDSIHICQGLRGNGIIGHVYRKLVSSGVSPWIIMETVHDRGLRGSFKRLIYRFYLLKIKWSSAGILAIGHQTRSWLCRLGYPANRVFEFAYFLPIVKFPAIAEAPSKSNLFRLIYVGQLIPRKRVDLLIEALGELATELDFEVIVVGSGNIERQLRAAGESRLSGRIHWVGRQSAYEVRVAMMAADCLVLPSRSDGWGAVVSEAMMVGTPVICSDACGAAGVVSRSGFGDVFASGDLMSLQRCLEKQLHGGKVNIVSRLKLANWAKSLNAEAGATYLNSILKRDLSGFEQHLRPPWYVD